DGVEVRRMRLEGVDHCCGGKGQTSATAPDGGFLRAASGHIEDLCAPRRLCAGNSYAKRVGDEDFRRTTGLIRKLAAGDPRQMRDDPVDNGVTHLAASGGGEPCDGTGVVDRVEPGDRLAQFA